MAVCAIISCAWIPHAISLFVFGPIATSMALRVSQSLAATDDAQRRMYAMKVFMAFSQGGKFEPAHESVSPAAKPRR
jgi:hypothetical protein